MNVEGVKVEETTLPGVLVFEPRVFGDSRGYFLETFQEERYAEHGVGRMVQLNHSHSARGTLRGLHYQEPRPQGKLVWAASGAIFDVALDVRRGSPTFGEWMSVELSAENHRQIWVPAGFAHGFCVLSPEADVCYGCTDYYARECEQAILWNDPALAIDWPLEGTILSEKDAGAPLLANARVLPIFDG